MYRKNVSRKHKSKDRSRGSVGRPRALASASRKNISPWREKARLEAVATQYNTTGVVDDKTLETVLNEQMRGNMGKCTAPNCDSCWHV
jgi:hypothetical protein